MQASARAHISWSTPVTVCAPRVYIYMLARPVEHSAKRSPEEEDRTLTLGASTPAGYRLQRDHDRRPTTTSRRLVVVARVYSAVVYSLHVVFCRGAATAAHARAQSTLLDERHRDSNLPANWQTVARGLLPLLPRPACSISALHPAQGKLPRQLPYVARATAARGAASRDNCAPEHVAAQQILVLADGAIPPAPAMLASTRISVRLQRVQRHRSPVNRRAAAPVQQDQLLLQ